MPNEENCQKIANIIESYRDGEFGSYNCEHVKRWVSQFDENEQEVILLETHKLLKRNYITQDIFLKFVNVLIDSNSIYTGDKENYWKSVSALSIQINGNSQTELNEIVSRSIFERYGVTDMIGKESDEYIYLDDFIFSGNRLYSDLECWIKDRAPDNCRVCIITIGWFIYGQWNTQKRLEKLVKEVGKAIKFSFRSFEIFRLENRLSKKDYSEVFWPTNIVSDIENYSEWQAKENFEPKYRITNSSQNKIFSSSRREEYEKIIFKYGLKIIGFSSNTSAVVKPFGYSTFKGFGFGSTVFSFRNCPNNNPLVFWWGDPKASSSHPFSKWYPLLQRKTYGS